MYATWFNYGVITYRGTKKGILSYDGVKYNPVVWLMTPHVQGGQNNTAGMYWSDGVYNQAMGYSEKGARPALYQEGTPE